MNMTTFKLKVTLAIIILFVFNANAQDIKYARKQLECLCSPEFHSRAYYNKEDSIAANYQASQFKRFRLRSYVTDYFQEYSFNVNSLEEISVKINSEELEFGIDFMMNPSSGSLSGKLILS
ncbi:unnamed protein product [marine sediment metagenome]|uniref:Uncharacterized protein n=1 Tax=marine sediment metagenome TaxID=412755 RepID=X1SYX9_9ZZZZ